MSNASQEGFGCGRQTIGLSGMYGLAEAQCQVHAGAAREPFALPGTTRQYAPDRSVDIRHTELDLVLDPAVRHIAGTVTHTVAALADDTRVVRIHADELQIDGVMDASGVDLAYTHVGPDLTISLDTTLGAGEEATVVVRYQGVPRRGIYFVAPDEAYPDKPVQAWTQGQDEDSRFWFPCFDHPSEKMSTALRARVPAGNTVLSNGALVSKEDHDDGTVTWHWKQALPHAAYLVTLVVGEFEELTLRGGDVPLTAYVPAGTGAIAERAFGRTAEMVDLFEERFGVRYPYEKYAQVVVEDFIFGGMENTTATTLIDLVLYDDRAALDFDMDDLVAHELAHQWWGDLLTCRQWSHAWLNEGFATWSEIIWTDHHKGVDESAHKRLVNLEAYFVEDGGAYRRPIVDKHYDEPIDLFDRHLYQKGSLVLHMLRKELGEGPFWRAVQTYARENRGRTVVTEDLRRSVEAATGRNIEGFLDQWVYGAGHPQLDVSWSYDDRAALVAVTVKQTHAAEKRTARAFRFGVDLEVHVGAERHRERVQVTSREQTFHVPASSKPDLVLFDPEGDLLAQIKHTHPAEADRAVLTSDAPIRAKIRAAERLGKDPSADNLAALTQGLSDAFWGVAAACAKALGKTRHPVARDVLITAISKTPEPRARRAVVTALGSFRGDQRAGDALIGVLETGDPSIFVEGAAAAALGETRAVGARAALAKALAESDSWAEVIRIACIRGLSVLGEESVLPLLLARVAYGNPPRVRQAGAAALATLGRRMSVRTPVLEALADMVAEGEFRVVMAAIAALGALGDPAGLPILQQAPVAHPDGRVRRSARVAAAALRKGTHRTTEVSKLSDEVEKLRSAHAAALARIDKLERQD